MTTAYVSIPEIAGLVPACQLDLHARRNSEHDSKKASHLRRMATEAIARPSTDSDGHSFARASTLRRRKRLRRRRRRGQKGHGGAGRAIDDLDAWSGEGDTETDGDEDDVGGKSGKSFSKASATSHALERKSSWMAGPWLSRADNEKYTKEHVRNSVLHRFLEAGDARQFSNVLMKKVWRYGVALSSCAAVAARRGVLRGEVCCEGGGGGGGGGCFGLLLI